MSVRRGPMTAKMMIRAGTITEASVVIPETPVSRPTPRPLKSQLSVLVFFYYLCFPKFVLTVVYLQSLYLSISNRVPGSAPVNSLQIHEHPGGEKLADRHIPDSGHLRVCQHTQQLQD